MKYLPLSLKSEVLKGKEKEQTVLIEVDCEEFGTPK